MKEKVLTKEVFQRDDCPKWAKYAAVDFNGTAFWYEEKPNLGGYAGTFWRAKRRTKYMCINGNFSRTVDLIERKQSQTNLEWLCEHPDELAKKLIHFEDLMGGYIAPDDKVFCPYDYDTNTFIGFDQAERRCIEYTVNWLKQEHKENNDDQKQS
jgi:hypothetical protein